MTPRRDDAAPLSWYGASALAALLVFAAVTFNAGLAVVNAHVLTLPPAAVVAAEMCMIGAAHLVVLTHFNRAMRPWYALIWFMALIALFRFFATSDADLKSFRDVLIIPTFVLLGMSMRWPTLLRLVLCIQAVTLLFLLLEATDTYRFAALFDIRGYYINTRGYHPEDFWNSQSNLYVSATRPDERIFLPFLNLHRTSSIFLEPVSLGNYCVVVTAFICAAFRRLSWPVLLFLVTSTMALIIGCDGRLSLIASAVVVLASLVAPVLPRFSAALYLPGVIVIAFVAVSVEGWQAGGDDFPGRIAHSVHLLQHYGIREYLGISHVFMSQAVDSGIAYLISTQSLLGVCILWAFVIFASRESTIESVRFTHGLSIFVASNFLISFSFLSVKTAALLWAIHGVFQAAASRRHAEKSAQSAAQPPERDPVLAAAT